MYNIKLREWNRYIDVISGEAISILSKFEGDIEVGGTTFQDVDDPNKIVAKAWVHVYDHIGHGFTTINFDPIRWDELPHLEDKIIPRVKDVIRKWIDDNI